jgi:hypothetical protein
MGELMSAYLLLLWPLVAMGKMTYAHPSLLWTLVAMDG